MFQNSPAKQISPTGSPCHSSPLLTLSSETTPQSFPLSNISSFNLKENVSPLKNIKTTDPNLSQKISDLKKWAEQLDSLYQTVSVQVEQKDEVIQSLRNEINHQKIKEIQYQSSQEYTLVELETLKQSLQSEKENNKNLQYQIADKDKLIQSMKIEVNEKIELLNSLQLKNDQLTKQFENLFQKVQSYQNENTKIQLKPTDKIKSQFDCKVLRSQSSLLSQDNQKGNNQYILELQHKEMEINQLKSLVNTLYDEINDLEQQIGQNRINACQTIDKIRNLSHQSLIKQNNKTHRTERANTNEDLKQYCKILNTLQIKKLPGILKKKLIENQESKKTDSTSQQKLEEDFTTKLNTSITNTNESNYSSLNSNKIFVNKIKNRKHESDKDYFRSIDISQLHTNINTDFKPFNSPIANFNLNKLSKVYGEIASLKKRLDIMKKEPESMTKFQKKL